MTIKVALLKAAAGTSKSAKLTSEPEVTNTTVERSTYIREPDLEHLNTYNGEDMTTEIIKTGETLASLELDLDGGYDISTTSEGDSECSIPRYTTSKAKKKQKRNKFRQLTSAESSVQKFDIEDMFDARTTSFLPAHKHSPLSVSLPPGEKLVPEEGSSPSTILPGNALQLHLDADVSTPETSFSFSSSSSQPDRLIIHSPRFDDQLPISPEVTLNDEPISPSTKRPPRVHFRSRVRITSGLHSSRHHTHRHETSMPAAVPTRPRLRTSTDDLTSTTTSGSPSSSISAPLRFQPAENTLLGPLGKRLSSLAQNRRLRRSVDIPDDEYSQGSNEPIDERTSFLRATGPGGALVPDYSHERRNRRRHYGGSGGEEDEDIPNGLKREENIMFGMWPWRLFNHHWWWYQCESVLCCCGDHLDEE